MGDSNSPEPGAGGALLAPTTVGACGDGQERRELVEGALPAALLEAPKTLEEALGIIRALLEIIARHQQVIADQQARIAELERRLGMNSQNSSRPPSSDRPSVTRRSKNEPSGRKPGGQPGHPGHSRQLLPPEKVKEFKEHYPDACERCHRAFSGVGMEVDDVVSHQVVEIPKVEPHVTEHRLHLFWCDECEHGTRAELPPNVPAGTFGPRVQATVAVASGVYHLGKRTIEGLLRDWFGVDLSLGSVIACEQAASAGLEKPVAEAHAYVQAQPVAYADETGWWQGTKSSPSAGTMPPPPTEATEPVSAGLGNEGAMSNPPPAGPPGAAPPPCSPTPGGRQRAWLWVAVTPLVTVVLIRLSRGRDAAKELLGTFAGVLVSDRWSAYNAWAVEKRQLCWAHLIRYWVAFTEWGGAARPIGEALLVETKKMFEWWHRIRDGTMSRAEFQALMQPVRERVEALLREGTQCAHKRTAGICREILKLAPALWTFVSVEGIEPTNNHAERAARDAVMWRKRSLGTHSAEGSRFVERILTVSATLKQQGRNIVDYVTQACEASLQGTPPPSLLPARSS